MDQIFNAGKDFLASQQGGGSNQGSGGSSGSFGGNDIQNVGKEASKLAGSSGDSDMFSQVMGAIGQRKGQLANEDVDEEEMARKHKQAYHEDARGDENTLGAAAAMQAFKKFTQQGGGGGDSEKGGEKNLLAMCLSEASKLFDDKASKGQVPDGASKQSVVQKAGEMAMKLYFKNQAQKQGGLVGMASQFMK